MALPEGKKQYHVTLNEDSAERVIKILGMANQNLSGYLSIIVDEFSRVIDDSGFSDVLDNGLENLKAGDALLMMGRMLKGYAFSEKVGKGILSGKKKSKA